NVYWPAGARITPCVITPCIVASCVITPCVVASCIIAPVIIALSRLAARTLPRSQRRRFGNHRTVGGHHCTARATVIAVQIAEFETEIISLPVLFGVGEFRIVILLTILKCLAGAQVARRAPAVIVLARLVASVVTERIALLIRSRGHGRGFGGRFRRGFRRCSARLS